MLTQLNNGSPIPRAQMPYAKGCGGFAQFCGSGAITARLEQQAVLHASKVDTCKELLASIQCTCTNLPPFN